MPTAFMQPPLWSPFFQNDDNKPLSMPWQSWCNQFSHLASAGGILDPLIGYATIASPIFTGVVTVPSPFTLGGTSVTTSGTELNYMVGVTSSVQTQITNEVILRNAAISAEAVLRAAADATLQTNIDTEAATRASADTTLQTNINLKANIASPTFTGVVTMPTPFTLGATSVTATGTELNYVVGVTSAIQTQLNLKAPLANPTFTGTVTIPTPFTIGAVSMTATGTELNYMIGVTSSVQTQLTARVVGPASSTANAIAIYNGTTGVLVKDSTVTIPASNTLSLVAEVQDTAGLPIFKCTTTASAVNWLQITQGASNVGATLASAGASTNIALNLNGKGTKGVVIGTAGTAKLSISNNAGTTGIDIWQGLQNDATSTGCGLQTLVSTNNASAVNNSAFGNLAGHAITTANDCTMIGYNAGGSGATPVFTTCVGSNSGQGAIGARNTCVGAVTASSGATGAATLNGSGTDNTLLGYRASCDTNSSVGCIAIGEDSVAAKATGATSITIGPGIAIGSAAFPVGFRGDGTIFPGVTSGGWMRQKINGTHYHAPLFADATASVIVVQGGALGTPSSGTLTSCTGLPVSTGISGLAAGIATFLATPSSANLAAAVTDELGSGFLPFQSTGTFTPVLQFGGASVGITYGSRTGAYTRTGDVLIFSIAITLTNQGSSTGVTTITGLPFASRAGTTYQSFKLDAARLQFAASEIPSAQLPGVSQIISLNSTKSNQALTAVTDTDFQNTTELYITGTVLL